MSQLSKSIIGKIKKKDLKPTPKWIFLLKRSFVWGLFGISVLFGSLAIGMIFFQVRDAGWDIYSQMNEGLAEFVLLALPYFWIILMIGFLALAYCDFRHTKKGYRYNIFAIIGLSLLISLVIGSTLYASGFSEKIENFFQEIPHYEKLHFGKRILWQRPDQGLLAGIIIRIQDDKIFLLQDFKQHPWKVDAKDAKIRPGVRLEKGQRVKMIGEKLEFGRFHATVIGPWRKEGIQAPPILPILREQLKR